LCSLQLQARHRRSGTVLEVALRVILLNKSGSRRWYRRALYSCTTRPFAPLHKPCDDTTQKQSTATLNWGHRIASRSTSAYPFLAAPRFYRLTACAGIHHGQEPRRERRPLVRRRQEGVPAVVLLQG
jgi:hypothetical protein